MAILSETNNITVLIAPLNWGLGHATRCIPIIKLLLQKQYRIIIATSGLPKSLLWQEFPQLEFIPLNGYNIKYGKHVFFSLVLQFPLFFKSIRKEQNWLQKAIEEYKVDMVISDNRYGLYTKKVPCIFITHQLQVEPTFLFKWTRGFVRKYLYKFINCFTTCWIPDIEKEENSLAGSLSHPAKMPSIPVKYVGWLSRFEKSLTISEEKKYWVTISLSGPEPQRTLLEQILLPQLKNIDQPILLIRGLPGSISLPVVSKNVTVVNHLSALEMQEAFLQSDFVISRNGYSTLMDMQVLQCKCIFIPTPGQTEQEYLGKHITAKKIALVKKQQNFNIQEALEEAALFPYSFNKHYENTELENIIDSFKAIV